MGNSSKYGLLYLATAIIVVHSILPHTHGREEDQLKYDSAHTETGFLGFLLIDLGEDHLENYEVKQIDASAFLTAGMVGEPFSPITLKTLNRAVNYFIAQNVVLTNPHCLLDWPTRGPPQNS